ncbi:MAG: VWA domain-containing protein [Bryobacterales bacterium]|nr:VWA domain-containing protein [Bryobacterales bacterium]
MARATAAQQAPPTFRATAPLVIVPVTVQDASDRPVDGLEPEDFELLDNGQPRRFDTEERVQPIALVIVVQASLNAAAVLDRVNRIGSMVEPLLIGRRGTAAVLRFANEPELVQPFTNDPARLTRALAGIRPRGSQRRQLDAVAEALRLLKDRRDHRRVILLVSERRDLGSRQPLDELASEAQRDNVAIYSLTFSPTLGELTAKPGHAAPPSGINIAALFKLLKQMGEKDSSGVLAQSTGGRTLGFLKQETLEEAITAIGEELHSQYLLSFIPEADDAGRFHTLTVRMRRRVGLTVRARSAYWRE